MALIPLFRHRARCFRAACCTSARVRGALPGHGAPPRIADGTGFGVVALLSGNEVRSPEGQGDAGAGGHDGASNPGRADAALLALRCVGAGRFRLHASQLAKYGLWMGEAEAIADDPPAEVPADLQDCADALGRLDRGLAARGRAGRAHAAGAAVPAGRLRLGGRPLVRAALRCRRPSRPGCWRCPIRGAPGPPCGRRCGTRAEIFLGCYGNQN